MTPDQIISKQIEWHGHSAQGCIFAAFLYKKDPPEAKVKRICLNQDIDKDLVTKVFSFIKESIVNPDVYVVSIIMPQLISKDQLIGFISLCKESTDWVISDTDLWKEFRLVKIRVPLGEMDEEGKPIYSWMLGFAPLNFLPYTRQAPFFEIILPTKSKYFLKEKFKKYSLTKHFEDSIDRGGSADEAHLADIYIKDVTDNRKRDKNMWENTGNYTDANGIVNYGRKHKILTDSGRIDFDDTNAKAKITFSYPVND
ncbi:MAG: hypothetical protein JSR97_11680 [Verrucomicrobia bacterium]|nr:hypothetical protein [Verrucomicrobiota bacterium]